MKDSKNKGKKAAANDGDEEMTVVVPPSKGAKQSSAPSNDADGDVSMGDEAEDDGSVKVDPAVQTVTGMSQPRYGAHVHGWLQRMRLGH